MMLRVDLGNGCHSMLEGWIVGGGETRGGRRARLGADGIGVGLGTIGEAADTGDRAQLG